MNSALLRTLVASAALLVGLRLAAAAEPLKVVASFSILEDFAKAVGGDRVRITTLVGPNGDAHVYAPRPADAVAVADADVVLVNGLHFEGFLQRLIEASGTKALVVAVSKGAEVLPAAHAHEAGAPAASDHDGDGHDGDRHDGDGHDHGAVDPHAWQAVPNAMIYVGNIAGAFCSADPAGCDGYKANAAAYKARLEALDAEIKGAVAAIPPQKRVVITSHDAFGYFAHAYGITFIAPEGVSTDSEASAADVAALIRQIGQDKASAIFVESITDPRLIEQIASETGLKVGGELYSDALSEASGPAATYIEMMRHNIEAIRGAVTGS